MRWIAVAMTMTLVGCGVEGAEVEAADAEQAMFVIKKKLNLALNIGTVDCDDPDYYTHPLCNRKPGDGSFSSSAGGSPNVIPSDAWLFLEMRNSSIAASTARDGTIELSLDGGESVHGILDAEFGEHDELTFAETLSEDGQWVTIQGFSKDREGHLYSMGTLGVVAAAGAEAERK